MRIILDGHGDRVHWYLLDVMSAEIAKGSAGDWRSAFGAANLARLAFEETEAI